MKLHSCKGKKESKQNNHADWKQTKMCLIENGWIKSGKKCIHKNLSMQIRKRGRERERETDMQLI